jgi:hypothetical protein
VSFTEELVMGMDLVELTMAVEDEFALSIPDQAAQGITTIGATIDFVVDALRQRGGERGVCPSARTFYRLRRGLITRCGARRADVRLNAPIGPLVGKRRRAWLTIATAAGLRAEQPRLFHVPFPPEEMSVREVIRTRRIADYRRADGSLDEAAIARRVFELVSEQTAVPVANLRRESRYIADLHMD